MAVNVEIRKGSYVSDGTLTARNVGFPLDDPSDLVVTVDWEVRTLNADYQITGSSPNQQIVPLADFATNGQAVRWRRVTSPLQDYSITGPDLKREALEAVLDRVVMAVQDAQGQLADLGQGLAGKFLAFDGGGEPVGASGTGADSALRSDLGGDDGSSLVKFSQDGDYSAGSVGGRLLDLPASLKAEPYFAVAAGDDTVALMALAASSDADIRLNINSTVRISDRVTFTDKNLSIAGNGPASSCIRCTEGGGLKFISTPNSNNIEVAHVLSVQGVSMICDDAQTAGNGPTAIEAEWGYTGSGNIPRALFNHMLIRSGGPGNFWGKGLRLIDGGRVHVNSVEIFNEEGHQSNLAPAAIEIVRNKASNITGFFVSNFWIGQFVNGLLISQKDATAGAGTVEGLYLNTGEIVNAAYAIHEDNTTLATHFFDSITVNGVHWNVSRAGFKSGRSRSVHITDSFLYHENFGDTNPAPLEACINILLQSEGLHLTNNAITRWDTITDDAPALLLPTAANLNLARVEGNQIANWRNLAEVQSGGALTDTAAKFYIGSNTMIATPFLPDYGFRGDKSVIGGHADVATGTHIDFGDTFIEAPAVSLTCRAAYVANFRVDNLTADGFDIVHDGVGTKSFDWMAVGT